MKIDSVYDLMADINKEHWYDITKPPGIAGEIAMDIAAGEVREQPRLRAAAALHELIIASGGKVKTPSGMKGNLLTICIAESAGGKDRSQSHFKITAKDISKGGHVFGRIASSKDIGRTLVNSGGVATFIIDECHSMFGIMKNKNGAYYMQELGSEILSVYSDRLKKFSDLDILNAKETLGKEIKKLRSRAKDEAIATGEIQRQEAKLEREILLPIQQGIEDPIFSMMCFSTPEKLGSIICAENIGTGLIGRGIFIKGKDGRSRKSNKFDHVTPKNLIANLKSLDSGLPKVAKYENDAVMELSLMLDDNFEQLRNDVDIGAVVSRSFEQVEKVSTALSIGNHGVITEAMLMWSYCFVCESLLDVISMLRVNESEDGHGTIARWNEIKNRIQNILSGRNMEDRMSQSQLIQKVIKPKSLNRLAESIGRTNGEEVAYGAELVVTPVLQALITNGAIDSIGRGYWISDAKKFTSTKISAKFMQIVDGVGLINRATAGWSNHA